MKQVTEVQSHPLFMEEVAEADMTLGKETYAARMKLLVERIGQKGLSHAVLYGDREHFANLEYFCGYDCRFEEALLVVDAGGAATLVVGNEGISQTYAVAVPAAVALYQNFSLPGQPRGSSQRLAGILRNTGINPAAKVGLAGFKYFDSALFGGADPAQIFDVPAYIVNELAATGCNFTDFTREIIGLPNGLRMRVRSPREIAWIENAGNRTAGVVQRMFKALKPGLTEVETGYLGGSGCEARSVFPMINFGAEHVRIGVRSPSFRALALGEAATLCYGTRGNLTSRVSVAAYDESTAGAALRPLLGFYREHWRAVAAWGAAARLGVTAGQLYSAVMDIIGGEEYGVTLNPSHYSGADEWSNASACEGSAVPVLDASHLQVDIIASRQNPVMTAICEDCAVVAGEGLRRELQKEYPAAAARILRRQEVIREVLGIELSADVLPMSNLNFAQYPYMLNLNRVFALR